MVELTSRVDIRSATAPDGNDDPPAKRKAEKSIRNQWLELVRVVSAFGIVWYHSGAIGTEIAYSGLSAFLAISTYLEAKREPSVRLHLGRLTLRLGAPWAFWFIVYALVNFLRHQGPVFTDHGLIAGILFGSSGHLWYLPFVFAAMVAIRMLRRSRLWPVVPYLCATAALISLLTIPVWRPASLAIGAPIAQYAQALAPAFIGVFMAVPAGRAQLGASAALLVALIYAALLPFWGVGLPLLIGVAAVAAALLLPKNGPAIAAVSVLTFGVYLIHPLFLLAGDIALHHLHHGRVAVAAFALSLAAAWAIRKRPGGRLVT